MSIDTDKVKLAVYGRIDYDLPEDIWSLIDDAFGEYWNEVVGFGNEIDETEVVNYIGTCLKKRHVLFQRSRLVQIVNIMFDYIEMTGGFLSDDDVLFIPKHRDDAE